ncbi:MAG: hypothetical protein ACLQAT_00665 [Candidatus Binataceae bacterium]
MRRVVSLARHRNWFSTIQNAFLAVVVALVFAALAVAVLESSF